MLSGLVCAMQDTDLVASDIAAGLALLHQEQDKMAQSRDPDLVEDHSPSSPIVSAKVARVGGSRAGPRV